MEHRKEIAFVVYFDKVEPNNFDLAYISETVPLDTVALKPYRSLFSNHAYYNFEDTDINFKDLFVKGIYKNKIKFYASEYMDDDFADYKKENYKLVNTNFVLEKMGIKNDTIMFENDDGVLVEQAIRTESYGTDSISTIFSHEVWKFDALNFTFQKNIYSYAPAIKFYRELDDDKARYKLLAYVLNNEQSNFSKKTPKKMKLFKKVSYEHGFDLETMKRTDIPESETTKPLFWNSYHSKTFKETIFDKIVNKKVDVYSFDKMQKLSSREVDSLLVYGKIEDIDFETGEAIDIVDNITLSDFKTIIFQENWYVNPKTMQIHKQVVGVAPVFYFLYVDQDNVEHVEKRIPFFVHFNQ